MESKKRPRSPVRILTGSLVPSLEADISTSISAASNLATAAARWESEFPLRLSSVCPAASVANAAAEAAAALQQYLPTFVTAAQASRSAADKVLESKADEIDGTIKLFRACYAYLDNIACCTSADFASAEDSFNTVATLASVDTLPQVSLALSCTLSGSLQALDAIAESSRIQVAGAVRGSVSRPSFWKEGEMKTILITLCDTAGEPMLGLQPTDVRCSLVDDPAGWSIASVRMEGYTTSVSIQLSQTHYSCEGFLFFSVPGTPTVTLALQVCAIRLSCLHHFHLGTPPPGCASITFTHAS